MLWHASVLKGYTIAATDGSIGTVSDFLFDDTNWQIRWLIVDTGNWLPGRKVLLTPMMLGELDQKEHAFSVELTMQQVKDSPDVDTDLPVSRQIETNIYDYYRRSPYWGNDTFADSYGYVGAAWTPASTQGQASDVKPIAAPQQDAGDPHLRSIEAVTKYYICASDGEIGHIDDFLFEDADWSIHYLVVDTKNWWPGQKVLISPQSVRGIDWMGKMVSLDVDRQKVKDSPAYDPSTMVDEAYDNAFLTYFGIKFIAPSDRP